MQSPRKLICGWSLALLLTLALVQAPAARLAAQNPPSGRGSSPVLVADKLNVSPGNEDLLVSISTDVQSVNRQDIASPSPLSVLSNDIRTSALIGSREVACQAAREWMPAQQLRQQARAVQELYCDSDDCARQAAQAIARFLEHQAEHQQDIAAAMALRAYYSHTAIEEQFELVQASAAELQLQRDRQAALLQKGIAAAIDLTSLDRESIAIDQQRLQLEYRDRQLTESLNEATHINYDWRLNSVEPLEVRTQSLDAAFLQQFALAHRQDLLALRCLNAQISDGTAPILASVVSSAAGVISLPLPKRCLVDRLLGRDGNPALTKNLKESLALAIETQSQAIRKEVSEKSITLELAYQRCELARETAESWSKRIAQLERLAELGDSRPADLAAAQSSWIASKAVVIERRLEAKLAEIAVAEACGGICYRCCQGQAWLVTAR